MANSDLTTETFNNVQTNGQQNKKANAVCQIDQIFIEQGRQNEWDWQQQRIDKKPWQKPMTFSQALNKVGHY
jgi:hypothetical protein